MTETSQTARRTRYTGTVVRRKDGRVLVRAWIPSPTGKLTRRDEYMPTTATKEDGLARLEAINAGRTAPYIIRPEDQAADEWISDMRITLEMWTDQWAGDPKMADAMTKAFRLLASCPIEPV